MATVSLCMIVKNEEAVLGRCLASVAEAVDEIIIVDTGSTDRTKEIARQFTDLIYDFEWIDHFSAARNFSFSKATMDYCMWLDADDVIMEEDRRALIHLKKELSCDVVMMKYHTAFDDKGAPLFTYYRERLLRREAGFQWEGVVHEAITPKGEVLYSEIAVTHSKEKSADPCRNLRIYEKALSSGEKFAPRDRFYFARELTYHNRDKEAIELLEALLEKGEGWIENLLESCRLLAACYRRAGAWKRAISALLHSFSLTAPRAEICCDLGDLFSDKGELTSAVFWYETALRCPRADQQGGFVQPDRYGLYPALQLCVCCFRQGDEKAAALWNEKAASIDPTHPSVLFNRQFFAQKNRSSF